MTEETERMNPWLMIWVKPTKTIEGVLENSSEKDRKFLQFAGAIAYTFFRFNIEPLPMWLSFIIQIIIGYVAGYFLFKIMSSIIYEIGALLDGQGQYEEIFTVVLWSSIPYIIAFIIGIPLFIMTGKAVNGISIPNKKDFLYNLLAILKLVLECWSTVILVICLKRVQKYSIFKSIVNIFALPVLIMLILVLIFYCIKIFK